MRLVAFRKRLLFDHMSEEMQEQMEKIRLGENK